MTGPSAIDRRRVLGGGAASVAAACLPGIPAASAAGTFRSVPKQLQVFRTPPRGWPAVAALCRDLGIGKVAIALPAEDRRLYLEDAQRGIAAFAPLRDAGLRVNCLVGDAAWLETLPGGLPVDVLELLRLHDTVFRFDALLLTIEPQALAGWKTRERGGLMRSTLDLLGQTRTACRMHELNAAAVLSSSLALVGSPERKGGSFFDSCLARLDEAVLASYRNDPEAAIRSAGAALDAVAQRPIPVWFGLTTQAMERPGASYYGLGLKRFEQDVALLHTRLAALPAGPAVAGIAINQFDSLRQLAGA